MKPKLIKQMLIALAFIALMCVMGAYDVHPIAGVAVAALAIAPIASVESSLDMKQRRSGYILEAQALLDKAKEEKRGLTADEQTKYDKFTGDADALNEDIKRMEAQERRMRESVTFTKPDELSDKDKKDLSTFSFRKAILGFNTNSLDGIEKEMHEEAVNEARNSGKMEVKGLGVPRILLFGQRSEKRAASATGGSNGSEGGVMVQTTVQGFIDALVNRMVMADLGITQLLGLTGPVDMPKKTAMLAAAWETENGDADETNYTFGKVSLNPRRLAAFTTFSKQLLLQNSYDIEAMIRRDLQLAVRLAVEQAMINGAGSGSNQPLGILNLSSLGSVAIGATGGAPTFQHMINLEREVAIDNADIGSLGYLTNAKVRAKLKATRTDTYNGLPVWGAEPNPVNGYKAGVTNLVPSNLDKSTTTGVCSAIIFGDFSSYMLAQFGGLDIVVDPYSKAKKGQIDVVVNSYWDGNAQHDESFAAILDATTT